MYDIRIRNLCLLFIPFLLEIKKSTCSPRATSAFQLSYLTASFNALPGLNAGTLLAEFRFLHQFVGYDLCELRVRELQSYQNRLIELFAVS